MSLRLGIAPGLAKVPVNTLVTHVFPRGSSAVLDALINGEIDVGIVSIESVFLHSDICIVGTYTTTPRTWSLLSRSESVKTFGITQTRSASHSIGAIMLYGYDGTTDVAFVPYGNQKSVKKAMQDGTCDATVWEQFSFQKPLLDLVEEGDLQYRDYTTTWPGLCFVCKKGAFDPAEVTALIKRSQYETWFFSTKLAKNKNFLEKLDLHGFSQRDFTGFLFGTIFSCLSTTSREGLERCFAELSKVPCKQVFGVELQTVDNMIASSCQIVLENAQLAELSQWPSWPAIGREIMAIKKEQSSNDLTLEGSCAGTAPTTAGIEVGYAECASSVTDAPSALTAEEMFQPFPSESSSSIEQCFHLSYTQHHSKALDMVECEDLMEQGIHSVYHGGRTLLTDDLDEASGMIECEYLMERPACSLYRRRTTLPTDDFHEAPDMIESEDLMELCVHSVYHRSKTLPTDDFHEALEVVECEDLMERSAHSVYHRGKTRPTNDFHEAPEVIEREDLMERCTQSVFAKRKRKPSDDFHAAPYLVECKDLLELGARSMYNRSKTLPTDDFHEAPSMVECDNLIERSVHSVHHGGKTLTTNDFHDAPDLVEFASQEQCAHSAYCQCKTPLTDTSHKARSVAQTEDMLERCLHSAYTTRKKIRNEDIHRVSDGRAAECDDLLFRCDHSVYRPS
eukprot:GEMP01008263.1.p1 GENE.GEMP01008263.1~~GEMP01008263.1.p1  ORF type:complete len:679 (+),score=102.04 GEMP01008263.1:322-2358(+)